jgi:hypothetical protein
MATPQPTARSERPVLAPAISGDGSGKIRLGLRQLKYEKELAQMKLPCDAEGLIQSMLRLREQSLEVKYNLAFHYTLLKKQGAFWTASGHKSLDAWLAAFDLPMGETLAAREHMVKLFSRETFLLVGDDMLGEMILEVSRLQPDLEKKKRDYQRIFDHYCKSNDAFDKAEFRKILRWYVNTRYVKPSGLKVVDNTAKPPRTGATGGSLRKVVKQADNSTATAETPAVDSDFDVIQTTCAGCNLWKQYAARLEQIITSELGAGRLPARPRGI